MIITSENMQTQDRVITKLLPKLKI